MSSLSLNMRSSSTSSTTTTTTTTSPDDDTTPRLLSTTTTTTTPPHDDSPRRPPPPLRSASPSMAAARSVLLDREGVTLWAIGKTNGCVPKTELVYDAETEAWWGGEECFGEELRRYEGLVSRLPEVLKKPGEIAREVEALPRVVLYASRAQKTSLETSLISLTGPGHDVWCPNNPGYEGGGVTVVLKSDIERERAFAVFAFLANAFIFDPLAGARDKRLPAQIAEPLQRLASSVGRCAITDYACSVLTNWRLRDPSGGLTLENVEILRTFTGTVAEKWFYAVHVVIEHQGGPILGAMRAARESVLQFLHLHKLKGKHEVERGTALQNLLKHAARYTLDVSQSPRFASSSRSEGGLTTATSETKIPSLSLRSSTNQDEEGTRGESLAKETARVVAEHLYVVSEWLRKISHTMARLPEKCPPEEFYFRIRPWLASWPEPGVEYGTWCAELGCKFQTRNQAGLASARMMSGGNLKLSGASGAQSSLLPSVDAFLGIAYGQRVGGAEPTTEVARTDLGAFIRQLKRFRLSMPPVHREMVAAFESEGNVRQFVAALEESVFSRRHADLTEEDVVWVKLAYNACIESLIHFRRMHTDFATGYIKRMASSGGGGAGGAAGTAAPVRPPPVKGTGGSDFATHLSRHVADTRRSLYPISSSSSTPLSNSDRKPPTTGM